MQLVSCEAAATYLNYSDPNCETNVTVIQQMLQEHDVIFEYKFVSQNFNPDVYLKNQTMQYLSSTSKIFPLYENFNQLVYEFVSAVKHSVSVQDNVIASRIPGTSLSSQRNLEYFTYTTEQQLNLQ